MITGRFLEVGKLEIFNPNITGIAIFDWSFGLILTIFHGLLIIVLALMITMRS